MQLTRFNYIDLTTSPIKEEEEARSKSYASADEQADQTKFDFIWAKHEAVHELVQAAIIEERSRLGICQLMNSSALGKAALAVCQPLMVDEDPRSETIYADFSDKAREYGYQGMDVGMAYSRETWPLDAPNEAIARRILDQFSGVSGEALWKDWGFGLSRGYNPETPHLKSTEFGVGVRSIRAEFGVGVVFGSRVLGRQCSRHQLH